MARPRSSGGTRRRRRSIGVNRPAPGAMPRSPNFDAAPANSGGTGRYNHARQLERRTPPACPGRCRDFAPCFAPGLQSISPGLATGSCGTIAIGQGLGRETRNTQTCDEMIMTAWLAALCTLFPAFLVPAFASFRGNSARRIVAGQAAGYLMTFILATATFVFDQPAFLDLALALAVVNLLMALMLEHWL